MKKIQIVFAVVAVLIASAGVFGTAKLPEDVFFQANSELDLSCSNEFFGEPCSPGTSERCTIESGSGPDLYISKKVNGFGDCVEHMRPEE